MRYSLLRSMIMNRPHVHSLARSSGFALICLVFALHCLCDVAAGTPVSRDKVDDPPRIAGQSGGLREWQPLPGPFGGTIRSMIQTAWGAWYAGGDFGIYRSDDDGMSWVPLAPLPTLGLSFRTLVPVSPDIIAVGAYRSSLITFDAGRSWQALPKDIYNIALDSSGILCATIQNSIHISRDSGRTWTGPTLPSSGIFVDLVYQLYAPTRGIMLAMSRRTLYRSTDGGASWDSLFLPFSDRPGHEAGKVFGNHKNLCIAILPTYQDLIWIYMSRDLGLTWMELRLSVGDYGLITAHDARGDSIVLVEQRVGNCIGVLHTSADGGHTWAQRPLPDYVAMYAKLRPDGDVFLSTWDRLSRVDPRTDGSVDVNNGLVTSVVNSLVAVSDSVLLAGTSSQLHRSTDGGRTWSSVLRVPACRRLGTHIVRLRNGGLLVSGSDDALAPLLFRSDDSGKSWHALNPPRWDQQPDILASDGGMRVLAGYYDGDLRISVNSGASWLQVTPARRNESIQAAAVDTGGRIFVCQMGALRYSDDWRTWETAAHGVPAKFNIKNLLPDAAGQLLASASYDGVYRSTDRGMHWDKMKDGLMEGSVRGFATDARGRVYATEPRYTYRLDPELGLWKMIARRPANTMQHSFTCAPSGRLFEGTQYFGVWTLEPPEDEPVLPVWNFSLLPTFPNPATGQLVLPFETDRWGLVEITIFDLLGRKIYNSSQWCEDSGRYSFVWNAEGAAKGVYLCILSDRTRQVHRRMLLQ